MLRVFLIDHQTGKQKEITEEITASMKPIRFTGRPQVYSGTGRFSGINLVFLDDAADKRISDIIKAGQL